MYQISLSVVETLQRSHCTVMKDLSDIDVFDFFHVMARLGCVFRYLPKMLPLVNHSNTRVKGLSACGANLSQILCVFREVLLFLLVELNILCI